MCNKALLGVQIFIVLLLCSCNNAATIVTPYEQNEKSQTSITENTTEVIYRSESKVIDINDSDLVGFWYDMPDISEGDHETYKFFDDGSFDYQDVNDILYSGNWNIADGILELTFTKQDEEALTSQKYSIEYTASDNNTSNASIILNNKKFWKIPEPQDIINGIPLYIKYDYDYYKDKLNEDKEEHAVNEETDDSRERIIISYDGVTDNCMICTVSFDDDFNFRVKSVVSNFYLDSGYFVTYMTTVPEGSPYEAILFTDSDGVSHSYLLGYNERDDSLSVIKTDIFKRKNSNNIINGLAIDSETIAIKFYYYDENEITYKIESINLNNSLEETIQLMYLYNKIRIDDIWYEGSKICVDLNPIERYEFDRGSAAGIMRTDALILTFSSFPGAEEIEFLIGGEKGCMGSHFSFDVIFPVKDSIDFPSEEASEGETEVLCFPIDGTETKIIGNARFNFWMTIPSDWKVFNRSENDDGYFIECENKGIDMRVYGENDVLPDDFYITSDDDSLVSEFVFDSGISGWQITKVNYYTKFLYKDNGRYITFYLDYENDFEWFEENQEKILLVAKTLRDGNR